VEDLSENLLEMEKSLEVDYSELIHDAKFADGAQIDNTIENWLWRNNCLGI